MNTTTNLTYELVTSIGITISLANENVLMSEFMEI